MGVVTQDDGWWVPDELWAKMQPLLPPRPVHPLAQAGTEAGPQKESLCLVATVEEPRKQRRARVDWGGPLRRTFARDVFACPRCGGRRKVLAEVKSPAGVRSIGEHWDCPRRR